MSIAGERQSERTAGGGHLAVVPCFSPVWSPRRTRMGSTLNRIRNNRSSVGRNSFICDVTASASIAFEALVLDAGSNRVQEAVDVAGLPVEDGVRGGRLTMSHQEHRVRGQLAC